MLTRKQETATTKNLNSANQAVYSGNKLSFFCNSSTPTQQVQFLKFQLKEKGRRESETASSNTYVNESKNLMFINWFL